MTTRCVVVGDVMMDVTAIIDADIAYASDTPAHVTLQPGGVAANTASWMAADGHPVTIVGCVGDDPFGHDIADQLADLGVDVRLQFTTERGTGTCVVIVDRRRERTMFPDSGANTMLDLEPVRAAIMPGCHVHLSGYTLFNPATQATALALLEMAGTAGATISLDPASAAPLQAQRDLVLGLLPSLSLLLANTVEATVLTGDDDPYQAVAALAGVVPTVVVKAGSRGVLAHDAAGLVAQPAPTTEIVDTTGAGDAFTAGFLPAWLGGLSLSDALAAGQRLAAAAVARVGANPLVTGGDHGTP